MVCVHNHKLLEVLTGLINSDGTMVEQASDLNTPLHFHNLYRKFQFGQNNSTGECYHKVWNFD